MSINQENSSKQYIVEASTNSYIFDFPIFQREDLEVFLFNLVTKEITNLSLSIDYIVEGVGNQVGFSDFKSGEVVLINPATYEGLQLNIVRKPALVQLTDFKEGSKFPAVTITKALDNLTMISQYLSYRIDNVGATDTSGDVSDGNKGDITVSLNGTSWSINNNAITSSKIINDAITTAKILNANVTADKLASDSVTTSKILNANVTAAKLSNDSVTTDKILASNVTEAKLANNAVTTHKIQDSAVTTAKINNLAVDSSKVGEGAVIESKIATNAVTSIKINSSAVTTEKINNSAVTYGKIQNVSGQYKILGRSSAGAGTVEEISGTSYGFSLLAVEDADELQGLLDLDQYIKYEDLGNIGLVDYLSTSFNDEVLTYETPTSSTLYGIVAIQATELETITDQYVVSYDAGNKKFTLVAQSGGGGGSPGGSNTHVQYNSTGSFAGDSRFTYDADGTVTLSKGVIAGDSYKLVKDTYTATIQLAAGTVSANHTISIPINVTGTVALTSDLTDFVTSSEIEDFVTTEDLNSAIEDFVTDTALSTALSSYVTTTSLSTTLGDYITTSTASSTYLSIADSKDLDYVSIAGMAYPLQQFTDSTVDYVNIAIPKEDLSLTDGYVVSYNATDDKFELVAQSGGGGGGGSPGGSDKQLQYNDDGSFEGAAGVEFVSEGKIALGGGASADGSIIFRERSGGGSNTITLKPSSTIWNTNVTLNLPADGTANILTDSSTNSLTNKTYINPGFRSAVGTNRLVNISFQTTNSTTATLDFNNTANATYTFPTTTGTLATLAGTEIFTNKAYIDPLFRSSTGSGRSVAISFQSTNSTTATLNFNNTGNITINFPTTSSTLATTAGAETLSNKFLINCTIGNSSSNINFGTQTINLNSEPVSIVNVNTSSTVTLVGRFTGNDWKEVIMLLVWQGSYTLTFATTNLITVNGDPLPSLSGDSGDMTLIKGHICGVLSNKVIITDILEGLAEV